MDIEQYFERIGYTGEPAVDIETLRELTLCHVYSVPFEDLDIQAGIPIVLDIAAFYDKVVLQRRGGYCYELNGLFYELLTALGFNVQLISARVANGKEYSPEYDHMALMVTLADTLWLVDVGFGDFSLKPLVINTDEMQTDDRNLYVIKKITLGNTEYYTVDRWNEGRDLYVSQYVFSIIPHPLADFTERNDFQQVDPNSHFTKNLLCSLPTDNGRISMINNRMIYTENGEKREEAIKDEVHRQELLSSYFGIKMKAAYKFAVD